METTGTDAGEYEIIPFNDTYKTSDTSGLAVASALAQAVGASGSGCTGLSAPGGQGTYYAQVINSAQAQLVLQQSANPASKNVMIILSDGDATACNAQANSAPAAIQLQRQQEPDRCGELPGGYDEVRFCQERLIGTLPHRRHCPPGGCNGTVQP